MSEDRKEYDVIHSVMRLSRAMRRRPPFPPGPPDGVHMLLEKLNGNDGVSSRELAELLDIRPSSLTDLLGRAEKMGVITRAADESDKRIIRVSMTDKGRELSEQSAARRRERAAKAAACFTDDEVQQFCEMCDRLCEHLEKLSEEEPESRDFPPPPPPHCGGHGRHGGFMPPPPPPFGDMNFPPMGEDDNKKSE